MTTNLGWIGELASWVGATEPALRLLLTIIFGYPLAFIYRKFVIHQSKRANEIFLIGCGTILYYFNYGWSVYHCAIAIIFSYLFIRLLRGQLLLAVTFIFHMGYLLIGYVFTATDSYDITWTMPHCVLVLRLIGLSFDVVDGEEPPEKLSVERKKSAINYRRSSEIGLLEIGTFSLFPVSFLVGPQYPFRRYDDFIEGKFNEKTGQWSAGLLRGSIGVIYLILNQFGGQFVSDDYMLSEQYAALPYWQRLLMLGIWGKVSLYRYISCWLLAEGACTCFGLTYSGSKINDWSGCANIKLWTFENATRFQHYIDSFNVNTNHWVAEYIYKRLKFFGNRYISQGVTLLFLAVWHGFHSGYYICFFMEFIVMSFEKEIMGRLERSQLIMRWFDSLMGRIVKFIVLRLYTVIFMGWCLVPFLLLSFERWSLVYRAVNYIGFILFVPFPIYGWILGKLL